MSLSVCCPWCHVEGVAVVSGVLEAHVPTYSERFCPMGGRPLERAVEFTDRSLVYHAATGDDLEIPDD